MRGVIVSKCPCKGYPFADRISEAFRTHFDNKSIRFRSTTKVPVQSSTITTTTTTITTTTTTSNDWAGGGFFMRGVLWGG